MSHIYGIVMRPCSLNEVDNEKVMRSTKYFAEKGFYQKFTDYTAAKQIVAESAKIFICKHYTEVKDWSALKVDIVDNTGTTTEYYKHDEAGWNKKLKFVRDLMESSKKDENPVTSLTNVVLDPTDGDFSLTINGKNHLWIDDDSIVIIADYIEKQLAL